MNAQRNWASRFRTPARGGLHEPAGHRHPTPWPRKGKERSRACSTPELVRFELGCPLNPAGHREPMFNLIPTCLLFFHPMGLHFPFLWPQMLCGADRWRETWLPEGWMTSDPRLWCDTEVQAGLGCLMVGGVWKWRYFFIDFVMGTAERGPVWCYFPS